MSIGFEFRETMSGSYHLLDAPERERAISFTIRAAVHGLLRFLRDRKAEIVGEVDVEGFADHRPMRGSLTIDPVLGKELVYDFTFPANNDRPMRFYGKKSVEFLRPLATMTTLPGQLLGPGGEVVGEARLRFDARSDVGKWLRSFKPT
jgi:hypothetical protein